MQQEKKIKGFTLLELLVTLTIVSIISGISFPKFIQWKKDREVRQAVEKAASMLTSVITHSSRGSYPYVQIEFKSNSSLTSITTKGMSKSTLSDNLNQKKQAINCPITTQGTIYWDADPIETKSFPVGSSAGSGGAIWFSREGTYYDLVGSELILNNQDANKQALGGFNVSQYIIFCSTDIAQNGVCPRKLAKKDKPAYLLEWSRFGNVVKYKWNGVNWYRQ